MEVPNRLGKRLRHLLVAQTWEGRLDGLVRRRDLLQEHCARNVPRGELLGAVPDVFGSPGGSAQMSVSSGYASSSRRRLRSSRRRKWLISVGKFVGIGKG